MIESNDRMPEYEPEYSGSQPGARLAEARAALKLSAGDVARQLKLSVAQVEALEGGQFDSLPGPVFVRGFIRNYARLVKLDPDELLRAAAHSLPQQAPRPEVPLSQDIPFPSGRPRRWRKYAWLAAVLIAAAATYEFLVSTEETVVTTHPLDVAPPVLPKELKDAKPLVARDEPAAPVAAVPSAGKMAANGEAPGTAQAEESGAESVEEPAPAAVPAEATPKPAPAKVPAAAPAPDKLATATPAPEKVATTASMPETRRASSTAVPAPEAKPAGAPSPADTSSTATPGERQATLEFEDESWVEVRDRDGKLLLFQLNPPGTRQVVRGLPPLSFVIGNAHGVRLTYDDHAVDLEQHTKTDVARLTLE